MAIRGNLTDTSLVDILQYIHQNHDQARVIFTDQKRTGVFSFAKGDLIHAVVDGVKGNAAAEAISLWARGDFVIEKEKLSPQRTVNLPFEQFLALARKHAPRTSHRKNIFDQMAKELTGFCAAFLFTGEGKVISQQVHEPAFNATIIAPTIYNLIQQERKALELVRPGETLESVTITDKYQVIVQTIQYGKGYIVLVITADSHIGTAHLYLEMLK